MEAGEDWIELLADLELLEIQHFAALRVEARMKEESVAGSEGWRKKGFIPSPMYMVYEEEKEGLSLSYFVPSHLSPFLLSFLAFLPSLLSIEFIFTHSIFLLLASSCSSFSSSSPSKGLAKAMNSEGSSNYFITPAADPTLVRPFVGEVQEEEKKKEAEMERKVRSSHSSSSSYS
jgi:hypothetical protein